MKYVVGLATLVGAGYAIYWVSTRPLPPAPVVGIRVPPEPVEAYSAWVDHRYPSASEEQKQRLTQRFAEVLERRLGDTH